MDQEVTQVVLENQVETEKGEKQLSEKKENLEYRAKMEHLVNPVYREKMVFLVKMQNLIKLTLDSKKVLVVNLVFLVLQESQEKEGRRDKPGSRVKTEDHAKNVLPDPKAPQDHLEKMVFLVKMVELA